MSKFSPKMKTIGLLLCLSSVAVMAAGWTRARSYGAVSTDNAYLRGDVTSLAPKVAGYVMAVEVEDNQTVRAGDVLFRIDDRDYRARLAQAVANVEAAQARLTNVDADTQLQHALIRQAEAQRRSTVAELNLATKASNRRRELIRTSAVSQAQVDESDAALSRAEAGVSAASATVEAQQQRIAVLASQREAAVAAVAQVRAARDLAQIDLDNTVALSATDRSALAGSSRRAPPCLISFRSTTYGSWRISRKPRSNISSPVNASTSRSTATRTRPLKVWWTALRQAAGLPSAFSPQTMRQGISFASFNASR
jgi:multidrug resistance efflux pump